MSNIDFSGVKKIKELKNKCKLFFNFEKPYGFMIKEITHSLYENDGQIQGNYLTAIGLFCYSEVVGREIMRSKYPNKKHFKSRECFNVFLSEYMGYKKLLSEHKNIYDWYRNGLCHNYKIKPPHNGVETGVFVYYDELSKPNFKRVGVDTTKGILLSKNSPKRIFIILPYFKHFIKGVEKFLKEKSISKYDTSQRFSKK